MGSNFILNFPPELPVTCTENLHYRYFLRTDGPIRQIGLSCQLIVMIQEPDTCEDGTSALAPTGTQVCRVTGVNTAGGKQERKGCVRLDLQDLSTYPPCVTRNSMYVISSYRKKYTSNGSWCMGIKGEMSGTVCVTFTWYMYIYELFIAFVCFVVCSLL